MYDGRLTFKLIENGNFELYIFQIKLIILHDLRRLEANNKNTNCSIGTKGRLGIKKNS